MRRLLFQLLSCTLLLVSCGDPKIDKPETMKDDEPINLNISDTDYKTYFVCDQVELNKLKTDLAEFGQHLDYSDTLKVDVFQSNNYWIVAFPEKLSVGQSAFLASWIPYGFCVSKNKTNPNKDIIFYTDDSIASQDFIAATFRDGSSSFKVNVVSASFDGINKTTFQYKAESERITKMKDALPSTFNLSGLKPIESGLILSKFKGFQPYEDTTKKNKSTTI